MRITIGAGDRVEMGPPAASGLRAAVAGLLRQIHFRGLAPKTENAARQKTLSRLSSVDPVECGAYFLPYTISADKKSWD